MIIFILIIIIIVYSKCCLQFNFSKTGIYNYILKNYNYIFVIFKYDTMWVSNAVRFLYISIYVGENYYNYALNIIMFYG